MPSSIRWDSEDENVIRGYMRRLEQSSAEVERVYYDLVESDLVGSDAERRETLFKIRRDAEIEHSKRLSEFGWIMWRKIQGKA